jgi:ribosomal RNA-processing protein 1
MILWQAKRDRLRESVAVFMVSHAEIRTRPSNTRIPPSLMYHLSDIYLEELNKILADQPADAYAPPLPFLLVPFFTILSRTPTKMAYNHVQSAVLKPLFDGLSAVLDSPSDLAEELDGDEAPPRKRPRLDADADLANVCTRSALVRHSPRAAEPKTLHKALLKQVLDIASAEGTRDANRRRLYEFWKAARTDDDDDEDG